MRRFTALILRGVFASLVEFCAGLLYDLAILVPAAPTLRGVFASLLDFSSGSPYGSDILVSVSLACHWLATPMVGRHMRTSFQAPLRYSYSSRALLMVQSFSVRVAATLLAK